MSDAEEIAERMNAARRREMQAPAIVFVVGLATIVAAWGFELIGNYVPCKLCLEERLPYYVGLPVVLAALLAAAAGAKVTVPRMLLIVAALIFAVNVYLGAYHAGAEWGWWAGPSDCGATGGSPTSSTDILAELETVRVVSCTEVQWRLAFLSFAGWNFVVSLFLVAVALWGAFRPLADGPQERSREAEPSWVTGGNSRHT
ncbi:MAG TPA: disulfide bond formation protein B [Bauldia sp.]|nr:disulfide bond formation protein B [Bauldia sp.]